MLMVSACAVSVSAYNDDAAISADYAYAVETLTNLGVINGTDTGDFNPQGTLTRASAATIIAKLATGGKIAASANAVANFADVAGHWGLSYINYVSQRGIMDGIGGGNFAPDANLTVAEALVIAVKAAGLKNDVANLDKLGTPSYWATNWIAVAGGDNEANIDLAKGVVVYDYTELCSREMFAQIAYNIFNNSASMKNAFGLDTKKAEIETVADGAVSLKGVTTKFDVNAFNAALAASGSDKVAADLVGQVVSIAWSTKSYVIYSVELDSSVVTYDYRDGAIKYVKEDDKFVATKIEIDGVKYEFGVEVKDPNKLPTTVGGAVAADAVKVVLTIDGDKYSDGASITDKAIPTYYKAVAYDDDGNGDYERVNVTTYELAVVKADGKTADDKNVNYKVNGVDLNKAANKAVTFSGVEAVLDGETPMLIAVANYNIDVLEAAEVVKGVFSTYSMAKETITVGTKLEFLKGAAEALKTDLIGMTVSVFTINGKYVKFANASTSDVKVIVDSADVNEDGKIVINGYNADTYAAIDPVVVEGYFEGIYKTGVAAWNTAKDADGKEYNTTLNLGYKDKDGKFQTKINLAEGLIVTLKNIDGTLYYYSNAGVIAADSVAGKLKVDGGYFYIDVEDKLTAMKKVAAGANILVEDKTVDAGKETGKYSDVVYTVANAFAEKASVNYTAKLSDDKKSVVAMFVKDGYGVVPYSIDYKTLDEGQSLIFIDKAAEDVEYVYGAATYTYKAIDLAKQEIVTVTSDKEIGRNFYLAKDGKVVSDEVNGDWISTLYNVTVTEAGIIQTVKAKGVVKTYTSTTDAYISALPGQLIIVLYK